MSHSRQAEPDQGVRRPRQRTYRRDRPDPDPARGPGEIGVRFTEAGYIITVDLAGRKIEGPEDLVPPREVFLHTWMYKTVSTVSSVVHVHPPTVVLFTICNKPLLPLFGAYDPSSLRLVLDGIATYPRSVTVSNDQIGQEFAAAMGGKRACLMRGHGITTVGASVEEATITAIKLNELSEMNFRHSCSAAPNRSPKMTSRSSGDAGRRPGRICLALLLSSG